MQLLVFIDKRIFFKQEHRRRNNTNFFQGYTRYTKSSRPEISKYRKPTSNGYRSRSLFKWTGSNKYGYFNLQVDVIIFYIFLFSTYIPKFVNLGGKNDSEAVQPDVASGSGRLPIFYSIRPELDTRLVKLVVDQQKSKSISCTTSRTGPVSVI